MANTILQKSLTSAATVPHATNGLKIAELGVNTYDGRVYLGTKVGVSSTAGGTATAATWVGAPILDEDNLATDSALMLATQQSIKAYVDDNAGTGDITGVTAGDGLTGGGNSGAVTLTLGVDDSTIEISSDAARVKAGGITASHLAADSVDSSELVNGSVDLAHMSVNSIDSDQYVDGSIDNAHLAANSVDSANYVDASIDNAHLAANSVDSANYVDGSIDNAHIADDAIDSEHYADGSIDNAHIADDAIDSEHYTNGSVDNVHLANDGITISGTDTSLGGTITFPTMSNVDMGGDFVIGNQSDDTCTITGHLTVAGTTTTTQSIAVGTADTIIFEGATADAYETTLTVVDPTAARTITLPNETGTVLTTASTIDIGDNTNLAGGTNCTLSGDTINVDDAFLKNDASDSTSGTITAGGFTTTGTWTMDEADSGTVGITTIQDSGSGFDDSDTQIMTAAAIADKIEAYGYGIGSGDMTAVVAGVGLSGGATSGSATLTLDLSELSVVTPVVGDWFATLDSDGANEQRTLISALDTLLTTTTQTLDNKTIGGGTYATS